MCVLWLFCFAFGCGFFGIGFGSLGFAGFSWASLGGELRFQLGDTGFQFGELYAGFDKNLLLDVVFFACYQVHFVERAAEHGFGVFFKIFGGAVGKGFADFAGSFFKKLFGNHGMLSWLSGWEGGF